MTQGDVTSGADDRSSGNPGVTRRAFRFQALELEDARAEVERLREELALRDDSLANRKVRELRVEVERLREALVEIIDAAENPSFTVRSTAYMAKVAREALGG
jgi:hypothetical protein